MLPPELVSFIAIAIAGLSLLVRSFDKSLSIREYEAYRQAVARDITRVEARLGHIEQTRPTTGELEILTESLNKRIDESNRNYLATKDACLNFRKG